MIDVQKEITRIDRQLAENQHRHQQVEYVELPIRILAVAGMITGMVALLFVLAIKPHEIPPPPKPVALAAVPFDVPAHRPDEATKQRALKKTYELVGSITNAWGSVDVSQEGSVTGP
jgi:hypothetical protein